jgi:hypothetical protein
MAILKTLFPGMLFALLAGMILVWLLTTNPAVQERSVALPHRPVISTFEATCHADNQGWVARATCRRCALLDNLAGRMGQQAEQFIWTNSPWHTDPLFAGAEAGIITAWYSLGYCSGYISEQIVIGIVTGGVGKIAVVLAKAGGQAAFQLAKRSVSAVWFRMHLIKSELANPGIIAPQFRQSVSDALQKACKLPLSPINKATILDEIEDAMSRAGVDRSQFNCKMVLERLALPGTRLRKLADDFGAEGVIRYLSGVAIVVKAMDTQLTGKAAKGWLNVHECLLPLKKTADIDDLDRVQDFLKVFKTETEEGKALLKNTLELAADKQPAEILQNGLKLGAGVEEVYPVMYHYADASTLLNPDFATDLGNGLWRLKDKLDGRYVGPQLAENQAAANSLMQLPRPRTPPVDAPYVDTKGRFKVILQTAEFADEAHIPRSGVHSLEEGVWEPRDWLEPLTMDNPHRGLGEGIQFTQTKALNGTVVDMETGQVVDSLTHLKQILGIP